MECNFFFVTIVIQLVFFFEDLIEENICVVDEGVYCDTYGKRTKDILLQWGELPTSVGLYYLYSKKEKEKICFCLFLSLYK